MEQLFSRYCIKDIKETLENVNIYIEVSPENQQFLIDDINAIYEIGSERDEIKINILVNDDLVKVITKEDRSLIGLYDLNDLLELRTIITKKIENNKISIYYFQKFVDALLQMEENTFLQSFSELIGKCDNYIVFEMFDNCNAFNTKTLYFSPKESITKPIVCCQRLKGLENCRDTCNFFNADQYQLLPDDFHLQTNYEMNPLTTRFEQSESILSAIYIASSIIIDNEILKVKIIGARGLDFEYSLSEFPINKYLYKIYNWIYNDGNIIDKAILARNVLSLHCKYSRAEDIDSKVMYSIQSNFKLYLKDNVNQYIELQNKIADSINVATSKILEYRNIATNKFIQNIMAIFLAVLVYILPKVFQQQTYDKIFTADVTKICELVILGSFLYMIFAVVGLQSDKKSIEQGYIALKQHYEKILTKEDIDDIDNNNSLNGIRENMKKAGFLCFLLWGGFLLIMFYVIEFYGTNSVLQSVIKFFFNAR